MRRGKERAKSVDYVGVLLEAVMEGSSEGMSEVPSSCICAIEVPEE